MLKQLLSLPALLCVASICIPSTAKAQADFGSVAVGASTSATITVTVPKASSFTAVSVVTMGATGLDYTALSGGTCVAGTSYGTGQTCTVNVQFKPQHAGGRWGAVILANPGSNTFATTFLRGIGLAPQMVFEPGVASAIYPTLDGYPLSTTGQGLAIDGAGTLYIASPVLNSGGTDIAAGGFLQVPSGSSAATLVPANGDYAGSDMLVPTTISPISVRVDGAGDRILNDGSTTMSLQPGASIAQENTRQYTAPAVDGKGDVFLFDSFDGDYILFEYSAAGLDGDQPAIGASSVPIPEEDGLQRRANTQATDANGNLFMLYGTITELPASGVAKLATNTCCVTGQTVTATENGRVSNSSFWDLIADGAGDLLTSDQQNNRIAELPPGGGEVFPISPVVDGKGLSNPQAVALDNTGNFYVLDAGNRRVVKIDKSQQAPLSFANTPVNTTSSDSSKAVIVKNTGTAALTFSSISFPADFPEQAGGTNPCSTSTPLAPGTSCNLNVTFKPLSATTLNETVTITDNTLNQTGTTQSFNVSGTGVADELTISSTSLSFGSEPVGYSTATQTVTVTNHGSAITFSSIALTGASAGSFVSSNTCGTTLAANATCTIGVRFAPTVTGAATAAVTLTDNAADSPQSIALNGTATTAPTASISLSATSLAFGSEPVGSSTATQNVIVTNISPTASTLYFNSIALSGANASSFITSNTCGVSIAAGASCRIGVRFVPNATGAATASVVLTDNASTPTQSISLTGAGIALTLSSSSLSFGNQYVGGATDPQNVTVTNSSSSTATFNSIALTGTNAASFTTSTTCGSTLAAGASCNIGVQFDPTKTGSLVGAVKITYNGSSSQSIALSGTGTISIGFSTAGLSFGNQAVGSSTATQNFYVTVYGAINFTSIGLVGPDAASFVTSNTCTGLTNPGSCRVGVRFVPTKTGPATANITFVDNATDPASPQSILLNGTGVPSAAASISLSSTSLSFGNGTVGLSTATQNVTVTNTSSNILNFNSIVLGGANASSFITSNTCGAGIAAGATCRIGVRFVPTAAGAASAVITLTDNAATPTQTISLSGTGQ